MSTKHVGEGHENSDDLGTHGTAAARQSCSSSPEANGSSHYSFIRRGFFEEGQEINPSFSAAGIEGLKARN